MLYHTVFYWQAQFACFPCTLVWFHQLLLGDIHNCVVHSKRSVIGSRFSLCRHFLTSLLSTVLPVKVRCCFVLFCSVALCCYCLGIVLINNTGKCHILSKNATTAKTFRWWKILVPSVWNLVIDQISHTWNQNFSPPGCLRQWSIDSQENHWNSGNQMSNFKAKMHQIRFRLVLRPRPHWGSLQRSPYPLAEFKGAYS